MFKGTTRDGGPRFIGFLEIISYLSYYLRPFGPCLYNEGLGGQPVSELVSFRVFSRELEEITIHLIPSVFRALLERPKTVLRGIVPRDRSRFGGVGVDGCDDTQDA